MKKFIRRIINKFGYDIIKYQEPRISKVSKSLSLYKTATGNYYLPADALADTVANAIKNNQIFEKEVVELASKYIKTNTVVLDVGANFGQMSILFSNMVGENGVVHTFEADERVYDILLKNIEANNKHDKIIPHFGAVHNIEDQTLIYPEQDFKEFGTYGSYGIDYNAKIGRKVKSITIDGLHIEETVSFMKVDIQGGDLLAMQGAVNTIKKNQMPIIFEYEYLFEDRFNMCFQDYVDFVHDINYKFHKVINAHNFLIIPK